MLAFNRKLVEEYRATGGKLSGPMAGRTLLLLNTTGATSGRPRTAVLGYGKDGDRYVVIASNNAAPAPPAWYRNLQAHPTATLEVGSETFTVRASTAGPQERGRLAALVPWLESQQAKAGREIPIVVLTPVR